MSGFVSFLHAVRHNSKLQIDNVILVRCCQAIPIIPKVLGITNNKYFWNRLSDCLGSLHVVSHP